MPPADTVAAVQLDGGHDGGGGEDAAQRPQVDPSGSGVAAGALVGGAGERSGGDGGQAAGDVDRQRGREDGSGVRNRQSEDVTCCHLGPRAAFVR